MFTACLVRAEAKEGKDGTVETATVGKCWSRAEVRPIVPGTVLLAEPGEAHTITSADVPASYFIVGWRPQAMERVAAAMGISGGLRFRTAQLDPGPYSELLARLASSVRTHESAAAIDDGLSEATTALVGSAAEPAAGRRFGSIAHPGIRRALELLVDNVREATSLDDLAKEARLSKYHFVRCFRHSVGFAPYRYRKLLRVLEARRLLEAGFSVAEAAGQANFADASHLSRTFREWVGVTPGLWASAWRASEPSVDVAARTLPPPSPAPIPERKAC
jgi:AraC-like DNA-binding protein